MNTKRLFLAAGIFLLSVGAAAAQPQCDTRDAVLKVLQKKYKEQPVALGVSHNGGLVEVLSTGNGTTWSIIITTPTTRAPDGSVIPSTTCLVAAGEGWRAMERVANDPEASWKPGRTEPEPNEVTRELGFIKGWGGVAYGDGWGEVVQTKHAGEIIEGARD